MLLLSAFSHAGASTGQGQWQPLGRILVTQVSGATQISGNGLLANLTPYEDCEMSFKARAPAGSDNVQIWAAIRVRDRLSRYAFSLRGGSEPEIALARYAPDGTSKFLGFAPLDFVPQPEQWYKLRVAVAGRRFFVYLNDETTPRINVLDADAPWTRGGIGLGGGWLPTDFANLEVHPLTADEQAKLEATGTAVWQPPAVDKALVRQEQRAAYRPVTIAQLPDVRGQYSLDGQWLFQPDQDVAPSAQPAAPASDDAGWNVIPVPSFWTPTLGWLHGESGMPGLTGLAASHGPSDKLVIEENRRVDAQTFDWKKTKGGWYREHLVLPANLQGREFHLVFDAISKIAEVWVNGKPVCSHTGMFGRIDADVTAAFHSGDNLIAVHDIGVPQSSVQNPNAVVGTAVTVAVTNQMLRSLPHGMTDYFSGGIWQPVKLVVTNPVYVRDVFIHPSLDSAGADVEIANHTGQPQTVAVSYTIQDCKTGETLCQGQAPAPAGIGASGTTTVELSTPRVNPKLWAPNEPNLYNWTITLTSGRALVDSQTTRFGFRTFEVRDGKLLLNGKPYWLRGADHFPCTLRPNDSALAHSFIRLALAGNVNVTRSHAIPFTEAWLDAADELGMGVSYEGTWPWLMLQGPPPPAPLIQDWKEEFASLIQEYRNHPSILFWTVNNEMKFEFTEKLGPEVLTQKWAILNDMIRTMRRIDPTRPIVPDSSYTRREADKLSKTIRETNHFDDGDIDDSHKYYGTYEPSFMTLMDGEFGKKFATPGRPLISQEMSTGYPRNDDWPSRSYEFQRYVPQAIAGDYSFEGNDPSIYMTRQAFMTKELAEVLRRTNRDEVNGILHFAYLTWFTDVWKADAVRPKLTYYALRTALQPVLVSAELYGRHFYAGQTVTRRVCLINDSQDATPVPPGTLTWAIRSGGAVLASGTVPTPEVPYYSNHWLDLAIPMPATLPKPKIDATLELQLAAGNHVFSKNEYAIVLATPRWAAADTDGVQLFDPHGSAGFSSLTSVDTFDPSRPLIVGDTAALMREPDGAAKLQRYVDAGGRALLLNPGADLVKLYPEQVKSYRHAIGEIVTMEIPESPVFDGIDPLDTAWFEMGDRKLPYASSGTYQVDRTQPGVSTLALECALHPDIPKGPGGYFKIAGAPLVEIHSGKGMVLASEIMVSARDRDPIAGRLLRNMIARLSH
ncbi:MAG TPA: glycoside hydrolase family 2 TIM barrel-domain containing protein [Chthoniobacteraceae bacterium]|nr:glycoside hydrolase family 2 TIM barrel-domain containing protein [Chthoniobacteraceae bacterium]